jgi:hypothetical protein
MDVDLAKMHLKRIKASWYNPRGGLYSEIGISIAEGIKTFDPPGIKSEGNDWVLILESL